jgi:hypothetical protein
MRWITAVVLGFVAAVVASSGGAVLYGTLASGLLTVEDIRLVVFIVLSGWPRLLIAGGVTGLLMAWIAPFAPTATSPVGPVLTAAASGGLVGYSYALSAVHVSSRLAMLAGAAAWSTLALAIWVVARLRELK